MPTLPPQLITVIEAPQHRSERVRSRGVVGGRGGVAVGSGGCRAQAAEYLRRSGSGGLTSWQPSCADFTHAPTHPRLQQDEEFHQISLDKSLPH